MVQVSMGVGGDTDVSQAILWSSGTGAGRRSRQLWAGERIGQVKGLGRPRFAFWLCCSPMVCADWGLASLGGRNLPTNLFQVIYLPAEFYMETHCSEHSPANAF